MHDVRNIALYFLYLALGSMAGAIVQTTCWMYVGNRQTNRLRMKYLAAVLAQNIGFFDVQATTGECSSWLVRSLTQLNRQASCAATNILMQVQRERMQVKLDHSGIVDQGTLFG